MKEHKQDLKTAKPEYLLAKEDIQNESCGFDLGGSQNKINNTTLSYYVN